MAAVINAPDRPAPPKPVAKPGKVKVVRALYRYTAQHADELSFEEGDVLYVYDNGSNGIRNQWQARCGKKRGWIPASYVEEQAEEVMLPLHEAARRGNVLFLEECLDSGVSGTGLDSAGNTPLYWAARAGHADCVKLLLALSNPPINAQNKMGDSPLHVAVCHRHLDVVNLLLEAGCNTTLRNNANMTAEDLACDTSIKNAIQMSRRQGETLSYNYDQEDYNDESD